MLVDELRAVHVVVGYDYTFGRMGQGTPAGLVQFGAEFGFGVTVVPKVEIDGAAVSSTRIRGAVAAGDVALAARLLGRPHRVDGVVERGRGVGSQIGFPTANIRTPRGIALPAKGVYACYAHDAAGKRWPAVCNVGERPTFSDAARGVRVEAHLVGTAGDFYNQRMSLDFVGRLRPEQAFESSEALVAQVKNDIAAALTMLD
ncbi:MAG: Riboflavin biosynthesis protein RibF [Firmicutes bacterium ADurb.Bin506]|nr:MAG: Riboflavin biosynthesis protein RibF [Firmicutes bacterium ADurb.Bin506]